MESYKHKYAKEVLRSWLLPDFLRVELESKYFMNGLLLFIPDVICFDENGINIIFEITHQHELDCDKITRIQKYSYFNEISINLFEIQAEWIMRQIEKPKKLKFINFTTIMDYDEF